MSAPNPTLSLFELQPVEKISLFKQPKLEKRQAGSPGLSQWKPAGQ
jgi:hypothetical protein